MDDRTERFNTAGSYFGSTIRQSLNFVSGKSIPTYSILYLDPSKNKSRGAVENIVVPNITISRGNRCHIRYSDEYGTVSREHASITSGEGGFYLNHNPEASNPTFINGEKISGPTLLHNGDEIQFSVNGPRLRINTNQSASGGITARLGRAIGQAVRPYKVAVWVLGVLLLVSLALGGYTLRNNSQLTTNLDDARKELEAQNDVINKRTQEIDQLNDRLNQLEDKKSDEYRRQQQILAQKNKDLAKAKENKAQLIKQIESLQLMNDGPEISADTLLTDQLKNQPANEAEVLSQNEGTQPTSTVVGASNIPDVDFDQLAQNNVYILIAKRLEFIDNTGFRGLAAADLIPQENRSGLWTGSAFLTEDGRLITARHVINPWRFFEFGDNYQDWYPAISEIESEYQQINVVFDLLSQDGEVQTLNSRDFVVNDKSDKEVERKISFRGKFLGFNMEKKKKIAAKFYTDISTDWAYAPWSNRKGHINIAPEIDSLPAGTPYWAIGFTSDLMQSDAQTLTPLFLIGETNAYRNGNKVLKLSKNQMSVGSTGGPVFGWINGNFQAIGIVSAPVGNVVSLCIPLTNLE